VTKNDDRWHPMCSHPLSQGACVDRLLGEEECRSPFGTYELLIPKDETLSCDQPGIRDKNCQDLDVSCESNKYGIFKVGCLTFEAIWYLTLGSTSKVTPPPWYKGRGLMEPPLGFCYVTIFRKDFIISRKL